MHQLHAWCINPTPDKVLTGWGQEWWCSPCKATDHFQTCSGKILVSACSNHQCASCVGFGIEPTDQAMSAGFADPSQLDHRMLSCERWDSGGDLDGDTFWVISDPEIVSRIRPQSAMDYGTYTPKNVS